MQKPNCIRTSTQGEKIMFVPLDRTGRRYRFYRSFLEGLMVVVVDPILLASETQADRDQAVVAYHESDRPRIFLTMEISQVQETPESLGFVMLSSGLLAPRAVRLIRDAAITSQGRYRRIPISALGPRNDIEVRDTYAA